VNFLSEIIGGDYTRNEGISTKRYLENFGEKLLLGILVCDIPFLFMIVGRTEFV